MGTSSEYCDIKTLLENEEHQLFAIKSLNTRYPSFVSHNVLYSGSMGQAMVSGSHCQGGDAASVSTLIKAYPKNEEFPEISNSNMLRKTPPTEPLLPPPPLTMSDLNTDDRGERLTMSDLNTDDRGERLTMSDLNTDDRGERLTMSDLNTDDRGDRLTMSDLGGGKRKTKRSNKKSNKRVRKTRSKKRQRGGGGQFSKQNPPTKSKMEPETPKSIPKKVTFPESDEIKKEYSDDPRFSDEFYNTDWFSKKEAEDEVIKEQKKEDKKLCKEQGWVEKKDILMCMNRERIKRENEKKGNNKTKKEKKKKATRNYYNRQEKIEKQQMLDDFTKQYNENKK